MYVHSVLSISRKYKYASNKTRPRFLSTVICVDEKLGITVRTATAPTKKRNSSAAETERLAKKRKGKILEVKDLTASDDEMKRKVFHLLILQLTEQVTG